MKRFMVVFLGILVVGFVLGLMIYHIRPNIDMELYIDAVFLLAASFAGAAALQGMGRRAAPSGPCESHQARGLAGDQKTAALVGCVLVGALIVGLPHGIRLFKPKRTSGISHRAATVAPSEERPHLRTELEAVYAMYLQAIRSEDAEMLCSVLTAARIRDLKQTFEVNGMAFPDDYFTAFNKYSPRLPPLDEFRHIGVTQGGQYANLIYVGDMKGYLRRTGSAQRFLIIQFEKACDGWKYAVITDPPIDIVPDLEKRLADERLDFLQSRPFSPEQIELRP